jgi:hypothetical protein
MPRQCGAGKVPLEETPANTEGTDAAADAEHAFQRLDFTPSRRSGP